MRAARALDEGDGVLDGSDDTTRGLGVVDAHRREAHLGIGCAVANAEVTAPALGFTTRLVVLPDEARPDLLARLTLTARDAVAPDELGRAIDRIVLWQDGLTVGG